MSGAQPEGEKSCIGTIRRDSIIIPGNRATQKKKTTRRKEEKNSKVRE